MADNDLDVARELIKAGVDVNAQPRFGSTALLTAVTERKSEFVRLLLEAGADLNQKGTVVCGDLGEPEVEAEGMFRTTHIPNPPVARDSTPLIVATRRGYANEDEITEALKQAGGKRAKELKGKRAPRPAKTERKSKDPVDEVTVPDFSERARRVEFQKAIVDLARISGKRAKPVSNDDGHMLKGCVAFQVPSETADNIIKEHHQAFLDRGCYLLKSQRGYTSGKDELTLLPTTERADVLAAFQTNGANCEIYTQDVIPWLDELEKTQPFLLTGAGFDWCGGTFTKPLVDSKKLAKKMYEFCPDIVDQGTGDVSRLALELKKTQRFFFWWD